MASVTFGPYSLDLATGELLRSGIAVKLQPQPSKLLVMLAERAGELVTRDEIRQTIWGADTFVDFDQSVNFCIRQVRTALRDHADTPCYVETVPRRGYRFIAPVQRVARAAESVPARPISPARSSSQRTRQIGMALMVIVALAASAVAFRRAIASRDRDASRTQREQVELGRFFLAKFSAADTRTAIEHFHAALKFDPDYAPAYAGLTEA